MNRNLSLISPKNQLLIKLLFADKVAQAAVDKLLRGYKMDDVWIDFSFLLALLHKKHPQLLFPPKDIPRLQGLIRYSQCRNMALLNALKKIGQQLNDANITPMLTAEIAKLYFFPAEKKIAWRGRLYIDAADYKKTHDLFIAAGYTTKTTEWGTEFHKDSAIFQLCRLTENKLGIYEKMYAYSSEMAIFGVNVHIPSIEYLLYITLTGAYCNMIAPTKESMIFYLYDCVYLLKNTKNCNWKKLIDIAATPDAWYKIRFVLDSVEELAPNTVPKDLPEKIFADRRKMLYQVKKDVFSYQNRKIFLLIRKIPFAKMLYHKISR
jgi:hypothetical protein